MHGQFNSDRLFPCYAGLESFSVDPAYPGRINCVSGTSSSTAVCLQPTCSCSTSTWCVVGHVLAHSRPGLRRGCGVHAGARRPAIAIWWETLTAAGARGHPAALSHALPAPCLQLPVKPQQDERRQCNLYVEGYIQELRDRGGFHSSWLFGCHR